MGAARVGHNIWAVALSVTQSSKLELYETHEIEEGISLFGLKGTMITFKASYNYKCSNYSSLFPSIY